VELSQLAQDLGQDVAKEVKGSQKVQDESPSRMGSNNDSTLEVLTERNLELAKSLPDFNIIELNRTSILSDSSAYKIVYTLQIQAYLYTQFLNP
jgi:hypothetical protein